MSDEQRKIYGVRVKEEPVVRQTEEPPKILVWGLVTLIALVFLALAGAIAVGGIVRLWEWAL